MMMADIPMIIMKLIKIIIKKKYLITEPNINHFPENDINQRTPNSGNSENNDNYSNIY